MLERGHVEIMSTDLKIVSWGKNWIYDPLDSVRGVVAILEKSRGRYVLRGEECRVRRHAQKYRGWRPLRPDPVHLRSGSGLSDAEVDDKRGARAPFRSGGNCLPRNHSSYAGHGERGIVTKGIHVPRYIPGPARDRRPD